jgi:hypothetical protein
MVGYQGYGSINTYTSAGESYYNSLQLQVNRRFGSRFQFGTNWTWQKTITYNRQQWVSDQITKDVANRAHAVNIVFGYAVPDGSRIVPRNFLTKAVLDGWNLSGVGAFFTGNPLTVSCSAQSAPIGWPNGTPTGGIPMRCQMLGNLWLPDGTAPPSTTESRLWYPFHAATFVLPPGATLGLGNTPPTLTYGPGFQSIDLAVAKAFRIKEQKSLEFRMEAFNALNHFNPSNPSSSITRNYSTGATTTANFGVISGTQNNSRRVAMSVKFKF